MLIFTMFLSKFSRGQIGDIFLIFPRQHVLTFLTNCLNEDNLHEMSKPVVLRKEEKFHQFVNRDNVHEMYNPIFWGK